MGDLAEFGLIAEPPLWQAEAGAMTSRRSGESTPDLFAASATPSPIRRAVPEADLAPTDRPAYFLPKDLQGALRRLPDAEFDILLMAVTEEANERGRLPRLQEAERGDVTPRFKLGQFHHQNAFAFAGCLVDGSAPPASVEDGRKALLLIQRAYEAARTGCRQQIHP